jgi:hypothetical protein
MSVGVSLFLIYIFFKKISVLLKENYTVVFTPLRVIAEKIEMGLE